MWSKIKSPFKFVFEGPPIFKHFKQALSKNVLQRIWGTIHLVPSGMWGKNLVSGSQCLHYHFASIYREKSSTVELLKVLLLSRVTRSYFLELDNEVEFLECIFLALWADEVPFRSMLEMSACIYWLRCPFKPVQFTKWYMSASFTAHSPRLNCTEWWIFIKLLYERNTTNQSTCRAYSYVWHFVKSCFLFAFKNSGCRCSPSTRNKAELRSDRAGTCTLRAAVAL